MQDPLDTHAECNEVTLVWGSLRLAPIILHMHVHVHKPWFISGQHIPCQFAARNLFSSPQNCVSVNWAFTWDTACKHVLIRNCFWWFQGRRNRYGWCRPSCTTLSCFDIRLKNSPRWQKLRKPCTCTIPYPIHVPHLLVNQPVIHILVAVTHWLTASCSMPIECEDVLDRKMSRKMYVCPELNVYYVVLYITVMGIGMQLSAICLQVAETAHLWELRYIYKTSQHG